MSPRAAANKPAPKQTPAKAPAKPRTQAPTKEQAEKATELIQATIAGDTKAQATLKDVITSPEGATVLEAVVDATLSAQAPTQEGGAADAAQEPADTDTDDEAPVDETATHLVYRVSIEIQGVKHGIKVAYPKETPDMMVRIIADNIADTVRRTIINQTPKEGDR